jgi:hypothetical protein
MPLAAQRTCPRSSYTPTKCRSLISLIKLMPLGGVNLLTLLLKVPHSYDDKFQLAEFVVNASAAGSFSVLQVRTRTFVCCVYLSREWLEISYTRSKVRHIFPALRFLIVTDSGAHRRGSANAAYSGYNSVASLSRMTL